MKAVLCRAMKAVLCRAVKLWNAEMLEIPSQVPDQGIVRSQDATERSWFKVSRFCYMLMKYSCDRQRNVCPTGTKVMLQTGTLCEYACGEKQMSTYVNARA